MKLAGVHALVTGATNEIGTAIAREFRARGAQLTVIGRDGGRLRLLAAELDAVPLVADLGYGLGRSVLVAEAERASGPLGVLVNNASLATAATAAQVGAGLAQEVMDVNAVAPMELCRQALPGMLARGRGHVLNISSLAGVSAVPELSLYGASKAALHQYTAVLQRELRGTPVIATLVTLGAVGTAGPPCRSPGVPARRAVSPEAVARALADAVERGTRNLAIPRHHAVAVTLRNMPSTLPRVLPGRRGCPSGVL
jgi:short-subunit dehydrogenase